MSKGLDRACYVAAANVTVVFDAPTVAALAGWVAVSAGQPVPARSRPAWIQTSGRG